MWEGKKVDWLSYIQGRNNKQHSAEGTETEAQQLIVEIEKAKKDWIQSQIIFDWADESEFVDYAIYAMEAAERRYMYLLNKAKRMNVVSQPT
jgi:hypothetical protein